MTSRIRLIALALFLVASQAALAVRITPSHSGAWNDPNYPSQGFSIEVMDKVGTGPERQFGAFWFTYDDEGAPIWAIGVGKTEGNVAHMTMHRAFGGARPPIEMAAEDLQPFADITFTFGNCHTATAEFTMTDSGETGTYNLRRLTRIGATSCTGGISDEVASGAEPITVVAQLQAADAYPGAQGSAKFKLRPAYADFEIDVRQLPEGNYDVRLDGEAHGTVQVSSNGGGNGTGSGTLLFSSPEANDQPLLDFDPRGMQIEIVDEDGVVALSVGFPADARTEDDSAGGDG